MDGETINIAQKKRKAHIDDDNYVVFAYGHGESDRDDENGYPSTASTKEIHEFTQDFVDKSTGRMRTPYEVKK